jgi:hypothetical protein
MPNKIRIDHKRRTVGDAASMKSWLKIAKLVDTDKDRQGKIHSAIYEHNGMGLRLDKDVTLPSDLVGNARFGPVDQLTWVDPNYRFYR